MPPGHPNAGTQQMIRLSLFGQGDDQSVNCSLFSQLESTGGQVVLQQPMDFAEQHEFFPGGVLPLVDPAFEPRVYWSDRLYPFQLPQQDPDNIQD